MCLHASTRSTETFPLLARHVIFYRSYMFSDLLVLVHIAPPHIATWYHPINPPWIVVDADQRVMIKGWRPYHPRNRKERSKVRVFETKLMIDHKHTLHLDLRLDVSCVGPSSNTRRRSYGRPTVSGLRTEARRCRKNKSEIREWRK